MTINLNPAQFAQTKAKLLSSDVTLTQESFTAGIIENKDVRVHYDYNGKDTLDIEVLEHKSFRSHLLSDEEIEKRMADMLEQQIRSLIAHAI